MSDLPKHDPRRGWRERGARALGRESRPEHETPGVRTMALIELIAQARSMLVALTELEKSHAAEPPEAEDEKTAERYDQSTALLLDNYADLARRIIAHTPENIAEMRELLMFCLEDQRYRLIDGERLAVLIGSLLRSPVLVGEGGAASHVAGRPAAPTRGAAGPDYLVCAEGLPMSGALDFDDAARLACQMLKMQPDASISIYDMTAAVHYF